MMRIKKWKKFEDEDDERISSGRFEAINDDGDDEEEAEVPPRGVEAGRSVEERVAPVSGDWATDEADESTIEDGSEAEAESIEALKEMMNDVRQRARTRDRRDDRTVLPHAMPIVMLRRR